MSNKRIKLLLIFFVLSSFEIVFSQEHVLYSMRRLPQAIDVNPAFQPISNFFISLPVLSSVKLSVNNSGFSFQDYNERGKLKDVADMLWDYNSLKTRVNVDLFRIGGRNYDTYHSFNISFRSTIFISYPDDLGNLIAYGNYNYDDNLAISYDLSQLKISAIAYAEFGYSYSKRLTRQTTYGYKIKLLKGIAAIQVDFENTKLKTKSTNMTPIKGTEFDININAKLAGLPKFYSIDKKIPDDESEMPVFSFEEKSHLDGLSSTITGNVGLAVDFGFTHKIRDNIEISGSIIDFGGIYWNKVAQEINMNSKVDWSGIVIPDDMDLTKFNFNNAINDNAKNISFKSERNSFFTFLPTDINLSVEYQDNKRLQYGSLLKLLFFNEAIQPQLSVYATYTLLKSLTLSSAYTIKNHSLDNLGLGIDLKLGFVQLYFLTDNLIALINKEGVRSIGLHLGLNFIFKSYQLSVEEKIKQFGDEKEIPYKKPKD